MAAAPVIPLTALPVGYIEPLPPHLHTSLFPHVVRHGVVRLGVHGDGSCFFHALAAAINYKGYLQVSHAQRQAIGQAFRCDFQSRMDESVWHSIVATTPHNIKRSFDDVRSAFCKPRVWAEETMIKYTSKHMGLNIVFVDGDTWSFYCGVVGDHTAHDTVVLVWVDKSHFECLLFLEPAAQGGAVALPSQGGQNDTRTIHTSGRLPCNNELVQQKIVVPLMTAFGTKCHAHSTRPV